MNHLVKQAAGLLMLPFCVTATRTVGRMAWLAASGWPPAPGVLWFGGGFLLWLVLFILLPSPVLSYVLAHEITHALWARLNGYRVRRLRVSRKGGSVHLSGTNLLVTLSPYFFPLYAFAALLLRALLALRYDQTDYDLFWLGVTGVTWSFHLTMTMAALSGDQPDIRAQGRLLAYPLIYLVNLLGAGLWLSLAAERLAPGVFGLGLVSDMQWFLQWIIP